MFGTNPKRAPSRGNGSTLDVKSIFKTLQGEGPLVGMPAIFVRLGGCNLTCKFCDTEFEDFVSLPVEQILKKIEDLSLNTANTKSVNLVVITGGEPLRQPIEHICQVLVSMGFLVQIETNGTLYRELPQEVQIVCSPKAGTNGYVMIREDLLKRLCAIKFLVSTNNPNYNHIPEVGQTNYNIPVYIQPMDEREKKINKANEKLAIEIALQKGYRLSYQLHKILGIE